MNYSYCYKNILRKFLYYINSIYLLNSHVKRIKNMGQYAWKNQIRGPLTRGRPIGNRAGPGRIFHQRLSVYSSNLNKLFNVKDPKYNFNFEK
jgi:hypothetical protein